MNSNKELEIKLINAPVELKVKTVCLMVLNGRVNRFPNFSYCNYMVSPRRSDIVELQSSFRGSCYDSVLRRLAKRLHNNRVVLDNGDFYRLNYEKQVIEKVSIKELNSEINSQADILTRIMLSD